MLSYGCTQNYTKQKRYCYVAIFVIFALNLGIELLTFIALRKYFPVINAFTLLAFTAYAVMGAAYLIVGFVYLALLLNVQVRLATVNKCLR